MNRMIIHMSVSVFILLFLNVSHLFAQWTQTNEPQGGDIRCLTVSGTTIFAGIWGGGVYKSTDDGDTWLEVNTKLPNPYLYSLNTSNQTFLFAGTNSGVLRSSINEGIWSSIGLDNRSVYAIEVRDDVVFAGTWGDGVYKSTNNGDTWVAVNDSLDNLYIYSLEVRNDVIFAGTWGDGVYKSTNNGETWVAINNGFKNNTRISSFAIEEQRGAIFAGTWGDGVYKSTDNGNTWIAVNDSLDNLYIYSLEVRKNTIFAGTDGGGIYRSTNNGDSWVKVNSGLDNLYIYSLEVRENTIFAGTWGDGVYKSTNNGDTWSNNKKLQKKGPQVSADSSITLQETACASIDSSLTIKNEGDEGLTIDTITFEPPGVITLNPSFSFPLTIGAKKSHNVPFTFDPKNYINSMDITCTIQHNAQGDSTTITIKPQKKTIILSAKNNSIVIPDTLYPGDSKDSSITITNTGTYDKATIKLIVENKNTRVQLDKIEGDVSRTGSEFTFTITSQEEGNFTDTIYYRSTECQEEQESSIIVFYNVGRAVVKPDKTKIIDLQVSKGEQISQTLKFTNTGKRYAQVSLDLFDTNSWSINPKTLDLKSDSSRDVTITFNPKEEKEYSTKLEYSYNDGKVTQTGTISLSGEGINPFLRIKIDNFGEQLINTQNQKKLNISNRTQSEYRVTEITVDSESVFILKNVPHVSRPLIIKPGDTDNSVTVSFEPKNPEEYNEKVIIKAKKDGAPDDSIFTVNTTLKGIGRGKVDGNDIAISVYLEGAPKELKPKDSLTVLVKISGRDINNALDSFGLESLDYTIGLSWNPAHLYLLSESDSTRKVERSGTVKKDTNSVGLIEIARFNYEVLWGATDTKGSIVFDKAPTSFKGVDKKILWFTTKGFDYDYNPYCLDNFIVRGGVTNAVGSVKSYPNPSTGIVRIEIEDSLSGSHEYEAEVYDMYGRRVNVYEVERTSEIDMSDIPLGQYRLEVREKSSSRVFAPSMITIMR